MAINVTDATVKSLQALVHDAFEVNSTLDRVKTVMTTTLVYPIFGNLVHMLAHKYSLDMGDGIGDLLEDYNEPVEYGNIPTHTEEYSNIQDAIDKAGTGDEIILLKSVEERTKEIQTFLGKTITTIYEENPGNHFQDATLRMAKGINWILK